MNLARLNHILIPSTSVGRQRWRRGWTGRAAVSLFGLYRVLTPRGRIMALTTLLAGGLGLQVESTQVYVLFSALLAVLAAALLVRRPFDLSGVRLRVRAPKRVAVGDEVRMQVELCHDGDQHHYHVRVQGPRLPWDGRWVADAPWVQELAPKRTATLVARARFLARGEHQLDPFEASALVPLGLCAGRGVHSDPCRFLVVPRIAPVARLTTPQTMRYQPGGVALASRTGESMELLGIRPYRPGDSLRHLHARSWARLGTPVVREYQEEYFTRVGVVVDTDVTGARERRLEASLSLAAGLVAWLSRGEALIDLLVVGGEAHSLTLGRSLGYLDQALDLLACVGPGAPFDPDRVASMLDSHVARLSCILFVTTRWDDSRRLFVRRIRAAGAVCKSIVIDGPSAGRTAEPAAPIAPDAESSRVTVEGIERGEALWL